MNSEDGRFYLLGGNYREVRYVCYSRNINFSDCMYISGTENLYGLSERTLILLVGTYYNRQDWPHLEYMIRLRNLVAVELSERGEDEG